MARKIEHKFIPLNPTQMGFKMLEDDTRGGWEGIPSPFKELDMGGDIIWPGSYEKDLKSHFLKKGWGDKDHSWKIGSQNAYPMDAKETPAGLWVKMKFHSTQDAQDERIKMKERLDDGLEVGLSIGFELTEAPTIIRPNQYDTELPKYLNPASLKEALDRARGYKYCRVLTGIKLYEVSVVTAQMEPKAMVASVKSNAFQTGLVDLFSHALSNRVGPEFKDMLTDYFNEWCPSWWELTDGLYTVKRRIIQLVKASQGASSVVFDPMSEWSAALAVFDAMITDHVAECVQDAGEADSGYGYDYYYYSLPTDEMETKGLPGMQVATQAQLLLDAGEMNVKRIEALTHSTKEFSDRLVKVIEQKAKAPNAVNIKRVNEALASFDKQIAALTQLKDSLRLTVTVRSEGDSPSTATTPGATGEETEGSKALKIGTSPAPESPLPVIPSNAPEAPGVKTTESSQSDGSVSPEAKAKAALSGLEEFGISLNA